jgi:taurine dioxygenase
MQVEKLAPALGAEVSGVDLSQPIAPQLCAQIRAAWLEHMVLRFRGQKLTDPQLLAFSRNFGELDAPGPNPLGRPFLPDHPEMNVISNIKEGGVPIGGLGDGEAIWHADMTYVERPPMAAILYAIEIPPAGGDTYWANMVLAYEALPAALKRRVEGLEAVHDATCNSAGAMRKGYNEVTDPRTAPGARHRLVRMHPQTGRRSLFLGRRRNSYRRPRARGERAAPRRAVAARHAAAVHLPTAVARRRRHGLGQPLHAAPARRLRPGRAAAPAPHADQGFPVTLRRSSSMRARFTPKSRRPRREAERTWTAVPSKKNSTSSTKPSRWLRNSAYR